ncbi:MAG TPA: ATP-binding protein [Streptosporangiaceae bacterium]|nr:ATP-binding protein [Streptosporangiaceae bacterium]
MIAVHGPGRLSLRARLLVVLIAVTAAFLLIMGGVTAFVSSKRLGAQFNDSLMAEAGRTPAQIQAGPGDYVAVVVTHFPAAVQPLTGNGATTQALADAVERLIAARSLAGYVNDTPFAVPGTLPRLRAVARFAHLGHSGVATAQPGKAGIGRRAGVLVVARPVGVITGQVGGIVVAELITGGALILLLALGGRWLIGRGLAPLSEMAGTAQRITTQGDLTTRMPDADGSTEVGRLGAAINTMLDRIQQAFGARLRSEAKVRQFAADASHELRTPLTTIRGYAELYRQGALDDDQLPDAMRRIEQEARRMGTLVAELLELARLDRTSSLDITETDLALLVRDAAADARAVEPARPVRAEAPESLIAAVDEARIRQVLANLLGNVREHTLVTTPTAVRLAQVRGGVVLEVADSGPGMAAEDAARAFDRFHRGADRRGSEAVGPAVGYGASGAGAGSPQSANGNRPDGESGGSGLGLAIVAAIAQAHGGQATLESAPGHGTRVRVWLPTTAPATPAAPRVAATPRLSRTRHQHAATAPATPQPGHQPSQHAGPVPRQPLSGPGGYPAPPPGQRSLRPARQPLPGPTSNAAPWHATPPGQPLPGSAEGPVPPYGALPGPPAPSWRPPAGPSRREPPARYRDDSMLPAPPGPPAPAPPAPHPGDGYPGAAELHHDWGDPPRPVPPRPAAEPPDHDAAQDGDGHPARPAVAP